MRVQKAYVEEYFQSRGMEAEFWRSEADHLLYLMVKPDLGSAETPNWYTKEEYERSPAPWHNWWLARFVRWVSRKHLLYRKPLKWFKLWKRTNWLMELAFAQTLRVTYERERLPDDTIDRVKTMLNYLAYRNIEPSKILMGPKARWKLEKEGMTHGYFSEPCPEGWYTTLFGLRIYESPFLAEDAVIVC